MAKVILPASLALLYYRGVNFTTRMVSPPVELKDDTVYILPFKDAKKLQNNNLGVIVDSVDLQEVEIDVEVEPNENTSVLQITRKPPIKKEAADTGHTLNAELDNVFGNDGGDEVFGDDGDFVQPPETSLFD